MHKFKQITLSAFLLLIGVIENYAQNEREIKKHLSILASNEMEGRQTGSSGLEKSAEYIIQFFESEEIKSYYSDYKDLFMLKDNRQGYNLIAFIEGSEPALKNKPVIIGAHYDHIGRIKAVNGDKIANGANDNASGTISVMQIAKIIKNSNPKRPVIFILFDAEEQGLVGSKHIAKRLKDEKIDPYVVFNIEMNGVPLEKTPESAFLTGYKRSNFAEIFNSSISEELLVFSEFSENNKLFRRSDNYPFYAEFKIPSHTVSTFDFSNYDYYHHVDDEVDNLDIEHIDYMITRWAKALLKIANHQDNIIKINK